MSSLVQSAQLFPQGDICIEEDERMNDVVETILASFTDGSKRPYHILSGSGPAYFLDPDALEMIRTQRGTEVVPIPGDIDSLGRILVRVPYRFLLIPEEEILEVGWN